MAMSARKCPGQLGGPPRRRAPMHSLEFQTALLNVLLLWILTAPHEFAHAWVATRLGDDTPRLEGRVTLNPLAHVDWMGTAILPFVTSLLGAGFLGWGRPVRSNPAKLRGGLNGLALVALAGPGMNVIMSAILALVAVLTLSRSPALAQFLAHGVELSLYLALFNLLPVPPLDGSKLLLAARVPAVVYMELARFGFMLLIVLVSVTRLGIVMNEWAYLGTRAIFGLLRVAG
ncbi:MAG TPA: site-2 protease family protein [Terriglobia bacterium]|nr:site-2 protease family protein [Terriglobia bacterium]